MNRYILTVFLFLAFILAITAVPASAHCPLCTAATAAGVAAARFYGVDDAITGLWIGALIISTALWLDRIVRKKYPAFPAQSAILSLLALFLTIIPFYFAGFFGNSVKILGIDRLLFGIFIGSAITFAGTEASIWMKNKRGKVLFPFQTILLVLAFLAATSSIFWYLIRNTGILG